MDLKFNLSLHLVEVRREQREHKYSLAEYIKFIELSYDVNKFVAGWAEGMGKAGPPFQTIKHNSRFLGEHFGSMRKEFADGVSEELNFKLKDLTEETLQKLKQKKEERALRFKKLSEQQKQSVESILKLLNNIPMSTRIVNLFDQQKEETHQLLKLNFNFHLHLTKTNDKENTYAWQNGRREKQKNELLTKMIV